MYNAKYMLNKQDISRKQLVFFEKRNNTLESLEDIKKYSNLLELLNANGKDREVVNAAIDIILNYFAKRYNYLDIYDVLLLQNILSMEEKISKIVTNKQKLKNGFVYIVKDFSKDNIYKIGKTKSLEKRIATLKTANPFIDIVASLQSDSYDIIEKALHRHFRYEKIYSEWFCIADERLKNIVKELNFNIHLKQGDKHGTQKEN